MGTPCSGPMGSRSASSAARSRASSAISWVKALQLSCSWVAAASALSTSSTGETARSATAAAVDIRVSMLCCRGALFLAEAGALRLGLGPIGLAVVPALLALQLLPFSREDAHMRGVAEAAARENRAPGNSVDVKSAFRVRRLRRRVVGAGPQGHPLHAQLAEGEVDDGVACVGPQPFATIVRLADDDPQLGGSGAGVKVHEHDVADGLVVLEAADDELVLALALLPGPVGEVVVDLDVAERSAVSELGGGHRVGVGAPALVGLLVRVLEGAKVDLGAPDDRVDFGFGHRRYYTQPKQWPAQEISSSTSATCRQVTGRG